jgi:hypothetical protein
MGGVIWTLVVLLVLFWVVGLVAHVGGGLIHALLVLALIVALVNYLTGRTATRV